MTASTVAEAIASGEMPGRVWIYSNYHCNYHCNLACSYCLTESSPRSERRQLTAEQLLTIAIEAKTLGFTGIGVTGGEPMLLPWLPETIAAMAEQLPVILLTNGTLFGDDRFERARSCRRFADEIVGVIRELDRSIDHIAIAYRSRPSPRCVDTASRSPMRIRCSCPLASTSCRSRSTSCAK